MAGTTTARRPKRRTQVRHAEAHWIDLSPFGQPRLLWKEAEPGDRVVVCVGSPDEVGAPRAADVEFDFLLEDLLKAFEEVEGRTRKDGDEDGEYGPPVEFGDLEIVKVDRSDYEVVAPCGEVTEFTGAELRGLVAMVSALGLTKID